MTISDLVKDTFQETRNLFKAVSIVREHLREEQFINMSFKSVLNAYLTDYRGSQVV